MAAAPVNAQAQTDPALQGLIDKLAANTPPAPPSAWPPPPLAWLAIAVLLIVVAALVFYLWRTRERRTYLKTLNKVRQKSGPRQALLLHNLLRNAAARQDPANASLDDEAFARLVAETLHQTQAPAWVNAHYRPGPPVTPDWQQAKILIQRWCR